ncbi:MAG: hypothetical protein ACI4SR_10490 [Faecalibacillus sp.]
MNKVALVTEISEMLGKAITLQLTKDGYTVTVNDLNERIANQTVEEILELG